MLELSGCGLSGLKDEHLAMLTTIQILAQTLSGIKGPCKQDDMPYASSGTLLIPLTLNPKL